MQGWRQELEEVIKTKKERQAEDEERKRQRLVTALEVADEAMGLARAAVGYGVEQIRGKGQTIDLKDAANTIEVAFNGHMITISLDRSCAQLTIVYGDSKPREFVFLTERHLAPKDVEDYVGRRLVELARLAKETAPW